MGGDLVLFVIIGYDVEDSLVLRQKVREKHLERLTQLVEAGRLVIAGPCPKVASEDSGEFGFTGSVVIAEFVSMEEAEQWAQADPYLDIGAYHNVIVKPFKQVLP